MSAENFQAKDDFGQVQRAKELTTSATVTTYTAKTGRAADDFIIDRVIRVDGTSGNAMAVTVPDGVYYGQRCFILLEVYAATSTLDVTTDMGDDATQITAAGGYWDGIWCGSTLGWATLNSSTT